MSHFLLGVELCPPKRGIPALIPRTCNVISLFLIVTWKQDVWGCDSGKRQLGGRGVLYPSDRRPQKREVWAQRHTEREAVRRRTQKLG